MRASMLTILLLLWPGPAIAQVSAQENLENIVRGFLNQKPGLILLESPMDGPLNRGGDAAAVAITKVVGGKDISSDEIVRILLLIHMSFEAPRIIENQSDRQPRTTLFILKYLSTLPASPELKKKIGETEQFVTQAVARSTLSGARGRQNYRHLPPAERQRLACVRSVAERVPFLDESQGQPARGDQFCRPLKSP